MLQYLIAVCALACPLVMLAMMWFMRSHGRRGREK
ncbi:MAG: DUF2933 domain-containing protein [Actinomycetota bacterium]|nr:DUF2933 domain-containing protein [Actinomycetota bacterium]MDQ2981053.1 DUF2933 domain-containing protein [Actinomycetota bacterium]